MKDPLLIGSIGYLLQATSYVIVAGFIFYTSRAKWCSRLALVGSLLIFATTLVVFFTLPREIAADEMTDSMLLKTKIVGPVSQIGTALFLIGLFGALKIYAVSRTAGN